MHLGVQPHALAVQACPLGLSRPAVVQHAADLRTDPLVLTVHARFGGGQLRARQTDLVAQPVEDRQRHGDPDLPLGLVARRVVTPGKVFFVGIDIAARVFERAFDILKPGDLSGARGAQRMRCGLLLLFQPRKVRAPHEGEVGERGGVQSLGRRCPVLRARPEAEPFSRHAGEHGDAPHELLPRHPFAENLGALRGQFRLGADQVERTGHTGFGLFAAQVAQLLADLGHPLQQFDLLAQQFRLQAEHLDFTEDRVSLLLGRFFKRARCGFAAFAQPAVHKGIGRVEPQPDLVRVERAVIPFAVTFERPLRRVHLFWKGPHAGPSRRVVVLVAPAVSQAELGIAPAGVDRRLAAFRLRVQQQGAGLAAVGRSHAGQGVPVVALGRRICRHRCRYRCRRVRLRSGLGWGARLLIDRGTAGRSQNDQPGCTACGHAPYSPHHHGVPVSTLSVES